MIRKWLFHLIGFIAILVLSIMALVPTFTQMDTEKSNYPIKSKINLGLDLQGGLYMVMGIDFDKVYRDEVRTNVRSAVFYLKEQGLEVEEGDTDFSDPTDPKQKLIVKSLDQISEVESKVKSRYSNLRLTGEVSSELEYGLSYSFKEEVEKGAVDKSIEVVRNRIDEFGVTEPEIVSQGNDRIVLQLPGVKDIEKAKSLIGKTAKLELKIVNDEFALSKLVEILEKAKKAGIVYEQGSSYSEYVDKINQFAKDDIPKGYMIAFNKIVSKMTNEVKIGQPYVVQDIALITGEDLEYARVGMDSQSNRPVVNLDFKTASEGKIGDFTAKNLKKQLAIIMDNNVYSAPVIQSRFSSGCQITLGQGSYDEILSEAKELALVLRAGALPVELEFQEQRVVGPSLGADSIEKAEVAGMIGAALVFLIVLVYYKFSGVLAIFTLIANVLIVLASLVGFEATLTLPGIAGIVLTIGMAVDANIIIFERIKEELAGGAPNLQAVDSGFGRAFWTILDANLTTAVAGFCLLNFGTGPIKGFAVTLLIGIIATVYASYFVGRMLFEFYMDKTRGKKLSI